ncbi:hypothetical protein D9Q98_003562 [Chlorella vulgaris]|uniref:EVE domain-containing protein n=1 Tax=Chlorella vulgaris TaxID=3077 RepID=A0A9D4TT60_CHLVU|nr:hypothetical protein D9Q98_003562 [Chlorella vulgaris]
MPPKRSAEGSPTGGKKAKTTKPASPQRNAEGKGFYLLKRQIDVLPISRFKKAPNKTLPITNIRSAQARKTIRSMQEGDEVLFYSCNNLRTKAKVDAGVYGRCTVVRAPYPDPADDKWLSFDLRLDEAFDEPVLLSAMKEHQLDGLQAMSLFVQSPMLSVHHVSPEHFAFILEEV